jgi:20S proteasome alpha/beta subunit
MTFQVGMVGKDGILLASDKLLTANLAVRSSFISSKIVITKAGQLAYCCAGDDLTILAAQFFSKVEDKPYLSFKDKLELCAQKAFSVESSTRHEREMPLRGGCILIARVSSSGPAELWRLSVGTPTYACLVENKDSIGDQTNTARFFVEKYFPQDHLQRPIRDFLQLAAHAVMMAAATNRTFVGGGLEIVLCTQSGCKKLPYDEISALVEASKKIDTDIAAALFKI